MGAGHRTTDWGKYKSNHTGKFILTVIEKINVIMKNAQGKETSFRHKKGETHVSVYAKEASTSRSTHHCK